MKEIIRLESVGAALYTETMEVFPMWGTGHIDFEAGVPVDELDEEWFDFLSIEDHELLMEVL